MVSAIPLPMASFVNMRQGVNTLKVSALSDTRASCGSSPCRPRQAACKQNVLHPIWVQASSSAYTY